MSARRPRSIRRDPACGTCRRKCRKCDRARPFCNRCQLKGLRCDGYPPKFQFCDFVSRLEEPRRDSRDEEVDLFLSGSDEPQRQHPNEQFRAFSVSPTTGESDVQTENSPVQIPVLVEQQWEGESQNSPRLLPTSIPALNTSATGSTIDDILMEEETQILLVHFERVLSEALAIVVDGVENPFRSHVLPLAYHHEVVLHALLGLTACHISHLDDGSPMTTASLKHRASALHGLVALLAKEEAHQLSRSDEEATFATVLLLVFHDICESGISSHGAHLDGISFLCARLAKSEDFSSRSPAVMFFLAALAWLDVLRGFSGAEKLAFSEDVRSLVRHHGNSSLHVLVGCPPDIFHRIAQVIDAGKGFQAGILSLPNFKIILQDADKFFREWDQEQAVYPTAHAHWKPVADAFRHACLLRVLRWPDTFAVPCEDVRIQRSVVAILDAFASVSAVAAFYKRLLFPLFLAGADTSSPHQVHYVKHCIEEVERSTGFKHQAMTDLLQRVWEERKAKTHNQPNVPWMEYTCSSTIKKQHAYLFF
ncbi:unnamed protein product [Clonostachys chloroleuca]|uniref:Zn(2)-C6 fungal-type domain-containing protein n=1 Tax=Clonostachys chloroleuca TaxID=1926264 RepID=A0AA35PWB1_9HYPO|nr:unnamed protein product [Clonostachys chloroleuca]